METIKQLNRRPVLTGIIFGLSVLIMGWFCKESYIILLDLQSFESPLLTCSCAILSLLFLIICLIYFPMMVITACNTIFDDKSEILSVSEKKEIIKNQMQFINHLIGKVYILSVHILLAFLACVGSVVSVLIVKGFV